VAAKKPAKRVTLGKGAARKVTGKAAGKARRSPDARIDAYVAKSAEFAQPILMHLRGLVHEACPEVEETVKWGAPHFEYRGMLCGMAAFKQHCAFGFWKGKLVFDGDRKSLEAMGQFGCIRSLKDLPSDRAIKSYVKRAMELNESGVKVARPLKDPKRRAELDKVPDDLAAALRKSARARKTFEGFNPSSRREYVEWIIEAKREATRATRLATTVAWLEEGKTRHWQYQ
jgi:uncharacterized protein YdeI (YjbR/CyaY-like superfamily)